MKIKLVKFIETPGSRVDTTSIGSTIFYAVGSTPGQKVVGIADNGPAIFSDRVQIINLIDVDFTERGGRKGGGAGASTVGFCSWALESYM